MTDGGLHELDARTGRASTSFSSGAADPHLALGDSGTLMLIEPTGSR